MKKNKLNDYGSIIADANYITERELLPLSRIRTEDDKARYKKRGYLPGYTYDEWPQKYPNLPRDKIYYVCGLNVGTVYYDKRNIVYVTLGIYDTRVLYPGNPENYEETIRDIIKKQEQHSQQKEYGYLFTTMPDGIKMNAMEHLLDLEGPTPLFYSNFMAQYATSNFLCRNLSKRVLAALEKSKSDEQKAKTLSRVEQLFRDRDVITVYRGEADGSTDYRQAMSWSPNINVAYFFATRLGKNAMLRTGKLFKQDVLEYFPAEDGGEEEIITLPGKVKRVTTLAMLDIDCPDIKKNLGAIVERYHIWRDECCELYEDAGKGEGSHDVLHSLRVLFLCIVIGMHEHFVNDELYDLCDAAIYHDAGRRTNGIERSHGETGAARYRETLGTNPAVEFAVEMHCADDTVTAEMLKSRVPEKDRDKAWKILRVLKDADALDRVRFGFASVSGTDGLDVNQLRYEYSKRLVPLAKQCLHSLKVTT